MAGLKAGIGKLPKSVTDRVQADLELQGDFVRVTLRDNGEFVVETKTGFGAQWRHVVTGNVGDGICPMCKSSHYRGPCNG